MFLVVAALVACEPPPLDEFVPSTGSDPTTGPGSDTSDTGSPDLVDGEVPADRPLRLLFLGNSFTAQGPIGALVRELAGSVGWPAPDVASVAPGGQSLDFHRANPASLDQVDGGAWDVVVLQDFSTRPTDVDDPIGFKEDATWFYDRVKASSPGARVVLFETWARHPAHVVYPATWDNPVEMQAQLRFHYADAAERYIPENARFVPSDDVWMSPVGDAWEIHLAEPDPLELHAADRYHASPAGQALTAMVLYSTIYGVTAEGTSSLLLPRSDAERLQLAADQTTGITEPPPDFARPTLEVGRTLEVDFGVLPTDGFVSFTDCLTGSMSSLVDDAGNATDVALRVTSEFTGSNESGRPDNALGWPATVSEDLCWVGSFDSHEDALLESATVVLSNLEPGRYDLALFASRINDDNGAGRLTRYSVGPFWRDLEVADNVADVAEFVGLRPDTDGIIEIEIGVSPVGSSRFGYLGALTLTRTASR